MNQYEEQTTETAAAVAAGLEMAELTEVPTEAVAYAAIVPAGGKLEVVQVDLERRQATPNRVHGRRVVWDTTAFVAYWLKYAAECSEVYADHRSGKIEAVLNAHHDADHPAWGDHRVTLELQETDDWKTWSTNSGRLLNQQAFAELIETSTPIIVDPDAADMLEIAQTFHATKGVTYESRVQVQSGEIGFTYQEDVAASAGRNKTLEIPRQIKLRLRVWEGAPEVEVTALFRYRIESGGQLALGWEIKRQTELRLAVFKMLLDELSPALARSGQGPAALSPPAILSAPLS